MDALVATGVRKTFEATEVEGAPVRALRGLDVTLEGGEFAAAMGPSGCGKSPCSTLLPAWTRPPKERSPWTAKPSRG